MNKQNAEFFHRLPKIILRMILCGEHCCAQLVIRKRAGRISRSLAQDDAEGKFQSWDSNSSSSVPQLMLVTSIWMQCLRKPIWLLNTCFFFVFGKYFVHNLLWNGCVSLFPLVPKYLQCQVWRSRCTELQGTCVVDQNYIGTIWHFYSYFPFASFYLMLFLISFNSCFYCYTVPRLYKYKVAREKHIASLAFPKHLTATDLFSPAALS